MPSNWSGSPVGGVGAWELQELRVGTERDKEVEGLISSGKHCSALWLCVCEEGGELRRKGMACSSV